MFFDWMEKEVKIKNHMKSERTKKCFLPKISLSCTSNQNQTQEYFINPRRKIILNIPTFAFSNLLTLFLQLTSQRSPLSPLSPIRLRKTDASVPLPPIVPVHTVTLYLMTADQNNIIKSDCICLYSWQSTLWLFKVNSGSYTYWPAGQRLDLHWQGAP